MSEWIDAEETSPKGFGDYLVCYRGHNGKVVERATYCGKWILFRTDSSDDSITVNPTHWMPVPAPPEPDEPEGVLYEMPDHYTVGLEDA